jgi:hypothetical protein
MPPLAPTGLSCTNSSLIEHREKSLVILSEAKDLLFLLCNGFGAFPLQASKPDAGS